MILLLIHVFAAAATSVGLVRAGVPLKNSWHLMAWTPALGSAVQVFAWTLILKSRRP